MAQAGRSRLFPASPGLAPGSGPRAPAHIIQAPSPNHGGKRAYSVGCVLHSTRGGLADPEAEFRATLNWFADPNGDSAHAVIAADGTLAECVDYELVAYHARWYNYAYLGVELVQPRLGDPITDEQYETLAWWLVQRARQFGFPLAAQTLPEHKDTPPGVQDHKSDIGGPFSVDRLLGVIDGRGV